MPLYPSLEDMKVDGLIKAQTFNNSENTSVPQQNNTIVGLYPSLTNFMGFDLSLLDSQNSSNVVVAPVSQTNILGIKRAEIRPGMRKIVLCKDGRGKIGLAFKDINKGIFVAVVHKNSAAALAGLRFGDQILEINDQIVAGFTTDKAYSLVKKCPNDRFEIVVRDRPFERTITLNKDSVGRVGFGFKNGEIVTLVKDSSAARNGLLTEHQLIEMDGQCVVGMTDKEVQQLIDRAQTSLTLTVMPSMLYKHMIKCIGERELRKYQDHSIPEI